MAIRVISSDERQSRRPQTSVAQRVTRRFRSAARRARRRLPEAAWQYAIGPGARNAARVTFTTGCQVIPACMSHQVASEVRNS